MISFFIEIFEQQKMNSAIIWKGQAFTYKWLIDKIHTYEAEIKRNGILPGEAIALESDFNPSSIAWLLALIQNRNIIVPLSFAVGKKREEFLQTAEVDRIITISSDHERESTLLNNSMGVAVKNLLYQRLKKDNRPGLVLFSSGSTGKSKASVHDLSKLLEKFKTKKQQKTILAFLLFDHIGGLNTLFYTLSNGGVLVTADSRDPEIICKTIEEHSVQILPTSPTFLNLMLLKRVQDRYQLRSLETITYGTEVMPETTLRHISEAFPKVKLQQTYGLSEIGIMRSQSEANDSLWVKIGGEGFETRVVDGLLEVKADSALLGYLNAPSPFTEDGWFKTGDSVQTRGEFFKILGRKSEIINVGGEKVYPAEVESFLLDLSGVEDVVVTSENNAVLGQIVYAKVKLTTNETLSEFRIRMKAALSEKVENFKIPQKVTIETEELFGARFKRNRAGTP